MGKEGIDILGHDNLALAIQVDLLKEKFGTLPDIRIISNIPKSENINAEIPYLEPADRVEELEARYWQPDESRKVLIGAMSGKTMKTIYDYFQKEHDLSTLTFLNLIHAQAYLAASASIQEGILVEPNASISSFAVLHSHVWIKRNASIGHHTVIHSFTNVNPGATIASCCEIGTGSLIGVGATISNKIKVGNHCIVGAGAVVIRDVPDRTVVVGNPARVLKENNHLS